MQTQPHRWRILAVCCMSLFIVGLDVTVVNVALPSIGRELHAGISGLQWTVDAYTLVLASLLMLVRLDGRPAGAQAHLRDRAVVFSLGVAAVQPGAERRAARRVPRAPGGRRRRCSTRSRCRSSPTRSPTRASARRRSASGAPCSASRWRSGRSWAALLVDAVGWRSIFWINLPVGLAAIVADAALHPRVAGTAAAPVRPRRPGAGDRAAGDADLRDHRGARARLVVAGHRGRVRGVGGRARRPAGLRAAPRGAADRPAVLPLDRRSRRRSSSRWPRSPRSAASCS